MGFFFGRLLSDLYDELIAKREPGWRGVVWIIVVLFSLAVIAFFCIISYSS